MTTLLLAAALATQAGPPVEPPPAPLLRVFVDCRRCDSDYIVKELTFVDHVRDSQSADIHAMVTTEQTGGGGTNWTIQFIGRGRFEGYDETVSFTTPQTATDDDRRRAVLRWLKLGLVTQAAVVSGRDDIEISHVVRQASAGTLPTHDPWKAWVFSLNANGFMNGERRSKSSNYRFGSSANRVTDDWKVSFGGNWSRNANRFEISETSTVETLTSSWGTSALIVKSLTERWSAGARASATGSTFANYDLNARLMAGPEYNFFPYSESTRRSLTLSYMAGVAHHNFTDVTIFDKLLETRPEHALQASLGLRQPWGSVNGQSSFSQQLDDLSKNRLNVSGSANVRLFRGFSFNVFGDYARIRDQINLRKGNIANEEVLLRLRQLATGYQYFMGFGVTYRFGSIYNNVVNPRFSGNDGGMMMFRFMQ